MYLPNNFISIIAGGSSEECSKLVQDFNAQNKDAKDSPGFELEEKKRLWSAISVRLADPDTSPDVKCGLLETLRILSRDKASIENVVEEQLVITLMKIAGLSASVEENLSPSEMLESLKVIFNFIYQSSALQLMLINNGLLEGLTNRIKDFKNSNLPPNCQYFTLRVLFMITALCQGKAPKVRDELNGVGSLNDFLEDLASNTEPYDDITVDIITESMKALYNIIHDVAPAKRPSDKNSASDEENLSYLLKITQLVRKFLLCTTVTEDKKYEIHSHSIDLLNTVTTDCYDELIPVGCDSPYQFEDHDMSCIEVMANFLQYRLECMEHSRAPAHSISPVLAILYRMAGNNRLIRKYLKKRILPPLTKMDLAERPEIGTTLRNRMCALLTSPSGITEFAANLLFVLCKESVNRMVKYTGYGNAAGLLASRGLMLGGRGNTDDYSSTSDDSDTEEYKEVRHLINDVEGWLQPERPPPCEGMTDEQKEYEAMKLVQAIDQLQRRNIIQPCLISGDGKPMPIEHILQLQGRGPQQAFNNHDSDSD